MHAPSSLWRLSRTEVIIEVRKTTDEKIRMIHMSAGSAEERSPYAVRLVDNTLTTPCNYTLTSRYVSPQRSRLAIAFSYVWTPGGFVNVPSVEISSEIWRCFI